MVRAQYQHTFEYSTMGICKDCIMQAVIASAGVHRMPQQHARTLKQMNSNQKYSDQFCREHWLFAGDVAIFLAEDLRPLQRVKGAHMVFTTALTFSRDEQTVLTVSADASALATKVSRKPASSPPQLYLLFAVLVCILALLCMFAWSRMGLGGTSGDAQRRAHIHALSNQEL